MQPGLRSWCVLFCASATWDDWLGNSKELFSTHIHSQLAVEARKSVAKMMQVPPHMLEPRSEMHKWCEQQVAKQREARRARTKRITMQQAVESAAATLGFDLDTL